MSFIKSSIRRIKKTPWILRAMKAHPKESSEETDPKILCPAILLDKAMPDLIKWWQVLAHVEIWTRRNLQHPLQTVGFVMLWFRLQEDGKKRPGPSAESGTHSPQ